MTDFNKHIDRTHTGSMKWSAPERFLTPEQAAAKPLPLWVADMDFQSPPEVLTALKQAIDTDIFGYSCPTDSYVQAVCDWQKKRFGWTPDPEWLVQTPGVVTALNIAIQTFTKPGESILIQPPVYVHFHEDVLTNGRRVVYAPLDLKDNQYYFDAAKFEAAIEKDTKIFILCNPHNPTGNVWSEEDLRSMGEICKRHNVLVISDEIHQDLIFNPTKKHIPFAKLGADFANNCIVCNAPSKTFNVAGLQVSNIFIPNPETRKQFTNQAMKNGINLVNYLGMVACEAAYNHGEAWLDELLTYIKGNHEYFAAQMHKHLPQIKVTPTDSLFLSWVDFRALNMSAADLMDFLTIKARVWFDDGRKFAQEGHGFMRVNLGCTKATVAEAVERLKAAIALL